MGLDGPAEPRGRAGGGPVTAGTRAQGARYGFGCDDRALFPGEMPGAREFADLVDGGLAVVSAGDAANFAMGYAQGLYDAGQISWSDMQAYLKWSLDAWPSGGQQSPDACYHYQRGYIEASWLGGRIGSTGYMEYLTALHREQAANVALRKDMSI